MILVGGGIEFCLYGMFCAPLEKILKLEIFWNMIYSILGNIWVTLFCSKLMIDSVKNTYFLLLITIPKVVGRIWSDSQLPVFDYNPAYFKTL